MPVPATTGQLRTKVSDMQIGDYLSAAIGNVTANGPGIVRSDTSFGDATNPTYNFPEIPLTGLTGAAGSTTGYFYFVKAARGLLIADRVVQNGVSWDVLNTAKDIQGLPWDSGNIIPTMTSNTAPSGVVSASGNAGAGFEEWRAFDKVATGISSRWLSNITTGWIAYSFGVPKIISKYTINMGGNGLIQAPKTWTFEGSNDNGVTWTILDRRTNFVNWSANTASGFLISTPASYIMYRLNITANNGDGSYVALTEIEMMETAGIIRSLTGGVAYADTTGNFATADANSGGWPANNEWDKYIVNSDLGGKITKGNDNVWHFSAAVRSWTQDTPALAVGASTIRIARGTSVNANGFVPSGSTSANTSTGFRPAFAYQE